MSTQREELDGAQPVASDESPSSQAVARAEQRKQWRRRRGAEATRALILESAASVFAVKGYYGTTIDDIAQAAGYSPAAIYKYFRNKEDLFQRLWNVMAERLQEIFDESVRSSVPFRQRLAWLVSRAGLLLEESPHLVVAFIAQRPYAALSTQSAIERHAYGHYMAHRKRIVDLMRVGIQEGVLRDEDPEDYANLFIGLLYEFAYKWVTDREHFELSTNVDKLVRLFLRGAGVSPSK